MNVRKAENHLRGDRTPSYVDRETGAAELSIAPNTWDRWVKEKILPPPCDAFPNGSPRWRWEDVDRKLSGNGQETSDKLTMAQQRELGLRLGRLYGQKRRKGSIGLRPSDEGAEDEGAE